MTNEAVSGIVAICSNTEQKLILMRKPYTFSNRCERCRMVHTLCICDKIPRITLDTKIMILMHNLEVDKPSNTSRLLKLACPETEITVFGRLGSSHEITIPADVTPLVLFPEPSAPLLTEEFCARLAKPVFLIVPDGTWQQARKLIHKRENLYKIPRVRIARNEPSRYKLRKNQSQDGLCTMEAIAEAVGALEGQEARASLLELLDLMVERVLMSRGSVKLPGT